MDERIKFLNISVDNLTMEEALDKIQQLIVMKENQYVVTPNVDHIVKLERIPQFRQAYREAALVLTDGKPLIWISRLMGRPIREKISGSDLFPRICQMAAVKGYRMFFLGAAPGVALKAAERLTKTYPGLQICGVWSPPVGFEKNRHEVQEIIKRVKAAMPDILILALGAPKQELFIWKYRKALGVPVSIAVGASIDFAAGTVKRAPVWMQRCGLEWLFRLIQEPGRLARRYLIDDPQILGIIIRYWKDRNPENIQGDKR